MYRTHTFLLFTLLFVVPAATAGAYERVSLVDYTFATDDCDSDGLSDETEEEMGLDPCIADQDNDSLTEFLEVQRYNSDPRLRDTDSDGLTDGAEVLRYGTDPRAADTDADGVPDSAEVFVTHTKPAVPDTDGDGLADGEEAYTYGSNPLAADSDADGLSDGDEIRTHRTDPKAADTDGDGLNDRDEVLLYRMDPVNFDTDGDGLSDGAEILRVKSDPRISDTDNDAVPDGRDACPLLSGTADRNGCPVPPRLGSSAGFPGLNFPADSAALDTADAATAAELDRMLAFMNQCAGMSVIVEGYAYGPAEKRNLEVSEARAKLIAAWLTAHGISAHDIELAIGYGSRKGEAAVPVKDAKDADLRRRRTIVLRIARACR